MIIDDEYELESKKQRINLHFDNNFISFVEDLVACKLGTFTGNYST